MHDLLARLRSTDPDLLGAVALALALGALFAAVVWAFHRHGRRLDRHREWLLVIEDRLAARGADPGTGRQSRNVQILTPRPPPLDGARTVEIDEQDLLDRFDKTRVRPPKPKDT